MRLAPEPPEIGDMDGFTEANDLFGYKEFGERLANLVQAIEGPATIILDGSWGTGKTVFAQQWAGLLRQRAIPVIPIDAFELDYHEDPFSAIVGGVMASADKFLPKSKSSDKFKDEFMVASKNLGKRFLPIMANVGLRIASAGVVGTDEVAAVAKTVEILQSKLSEASSAALGTRIAEARQDKEELEAFIIQLASLGRALAKAAAVAVNGKFDPDAPVPLVIIIDELDRCRPDFALGMLERIKHLFATDGIIFVLVTHLPQLEISVAHKYGGKVASTYLEKFYNLRITLPGVKQQKQQASTNFISHLWQNLGIPVDDQQFDQSVREELARLALEKDLSLRTLERLTANIAIVYAATAQNYLRVPPLLTGLCLMRQISPMLYRRARDKTLTWQEVTEFFNLGEWEEGNGRSWFSEWWKFVTISPLPEEDWVKSKWRAINKYHIDDPRDILAFMIGHIDDLIVREG